MLYSGERNYGCRFLEVALFELRTIILENEKIRVMFLLDKGTEIIEFNYKETDTDFIWRSPLGLSCLKKSQIYRKDEQYLTDNYTGGWFEAFPNLGDACTYKGANIPAYGEVCYLPWEYSVVRDDPGEVSLKCFVRTTKTPFLLEKTFTVKSNIPTLFINEKVTNLGLETTEFQWGHHPNFGSPFLDENCVIDLPEGYINVYAEIDTSRVKAGTKGRWPIVEGKNGKPVDFRKMLPKEAGIMDLLFLSGIKAGWAAVRNTVRGIGIGFSWDLNIFSNCVLWLVANGDNGYPRYGDTYVLCILPKSADIHTLSEGKKVGDITVIKKEETMSTWMTASAFKEQGEIADIGRDGAIQYR